MTDIASLILGLPSVVGGIVQAYQTVQDYRALQEDHRRLVVRTVFGCKKLVHYAGFLDTKEFGARSAKECDGANDAAMDEVAERRALLEEALLHANDALVRVSDTLEDWTVRLCPNDTAVGGRLFMAKIAASLADRLRKDKKRLKNRPTKRSRSRKLYDEVAYLATGCRQIHDAMEAMERWTVQFKDLLLASPTLRLMRQPETNPELGPVSEIADEILFVTRANERESARSPVRNIASECTRSIADLDTMHPTGIYILEDGPYAGCIVDRRNVDHLIRYDKEDQAIQDTNRIARIFAEEDSNEIEESAFEIGVLRCCGWAEVSSDTALRIHDMVFRLPPGSMRPRTLRMMLLAGPPQHSLNNRIDFCIRLATSVLIMHSLGLVHKDIRPDSILVVEPFSSRKSITIPKKLGEPYLGNFNRTRSDISDTVQNPFQYSPLMRTLYVHPLHTTSYRHQKYRMRDDIYSLGVCLLEIARWKSFFVWDDYRQCYDANSEAFDFSSERYERIFEEEGQPTYRESAWLMQLDLIELAEKEVPIIMGETFAELVVACLCFGDIKRPTRSEAARKVKGDDYTPKCESAVFVQDVLSKLRSLKLKHP